MLASKTKGDKLPPEPSPNLNAFPALLVAFYRKKGKPAMLADYTTLNDEQLAVLDRHFNSACPRPKCSAFEATPQKAPLRDQPLSTLGLHARANPEPVNQERPNQNAQRTVIRSEPSKK